MILARVTFLFFKEATEKDHGVVWPCVPKISVVIISRREGLPSATFELWRETLGRRLYQVAQKMSVVVKCT